MQSRKVIDLESDITYYGNSKLIATNHITTTIPVSVQPIIVVLVLCLVENTLKRTGIMIAFSIWLSFMLRILKWASFRGNLPSQKLNLQVCCRA